MQKSFSRRTFLQYAAMAGSGVALSPSTGSTTEDPIYKLVPKPGRAQLVPEQYGLTDVWCFNEQVPGPEIRVRQGDHVRIALDNQLDESTTVHWHGLRLPNNMDGVPHLTQKPISPGSEFLYQFDAVDAGTFWYHPHQQSSIQVGRGLYGALIIEEPNPPFVDRDITWILDDWRLMRTAQIANDFNQRHDLSHNGRIGNTITINGKLPDSLVVHPGERIRLRLINAANARIFGLSFSEYAPMVIAMDGQPVQPHFATDGYVALGPAMRVDLILYIPLTPGLTAPIIDRYYRQNAYTLITLMSSETPVRSQPLSEDITLATNPLVEPDLEHAVRHQIAFEGGAMGNMAGATMDGEWRDIREMVHNEKFWAINGIAASGHIMDPLITLQHGQSCILVLQNQTAWPHPIHLHGHSFRVLSRNGQSTKYGEWQDTVLLEREDQVEIAFVADNPGNWMFHCHILEHQAAGMMGVIRVG